MSRLRLSANQFGVGATPALRLRVSVATLVKVTFLHPEDGRPWLVLERGATLRDDRPERSVTVRAQPFGGAVRLHDPGALQAAIGNFHFDSPRSRDESDFRIQIPPRAWEAVKSFCWQHFRAEDGVLELNPRRELDEEFLDSLGLIIDPAQYALKLTGSVIENEPVETGNVRAAGNPTVRIYLLFEMRLHDPGLIGAVIHNSAAVSDQALQELAWADQVQGGRGRANAALVVDAEKFVHTCLGLPIQSQAGLIDFEGHQIEHNTLALFEELDTSLYRRPPP